jgi:hypothetical protein
MFQINKFNGIYFFCLGILLRPAVYICQCQNGVGIRFVQLIRMEISLKCQFEVIRRYVELSQVLMNCGI